MLLLFPLVQRPIYGIALAVVVAFAWLALRSVAWPVALAGLPVVFIGLLGRNPFPNGAIARAVFVWIALALLVAVVRDDALPLQSLLNAPALATVVLAVLLVTRLGDSLDPAYGKVKVQLFIAQNLTLLVAGIAIGGRRRDFSLLLVGVMVIAGLTAGVLAHGLSTGTLQANVGGRFALYQEATPIGLGRTAAQGILIAVFLVISARHAGLRLLALGLLPLISVAFIAAGSRGPVLGLLVGLVVLLSLALRTPGNRWRILLVATAGVVGAMLVTQLVPGQDIQRSISVLTGSGEGLSANGRTQLWHEGWLLFRTHPLLGTGTGSFSFYQQTDFFPHNLFLELGAEVGVIGVLCAAAVIVGGAIALRRAYRDDRAARADVAVVGALLVAAVVNAMFSSDVANNSAVWLAGGLAVGLAQRTRRRAAVDVLARVRPWRRERPDRRAAARPGGSPFARRPAPVGLQPSPTPAPTPGAVVAPADGAVVGGVVEVSVVAARSGWGVAAVNAEWSADGDGWHRLPAAQAFEVVSGGAQVALLRSRRLAEAVAHGLDGAEVRVSRRRPWESDTWSFEWDTRAIPDGAYRLRAVTVDVAGTQTITPVVRVRVAAAAAALPPVLPADAERELREQRVAERERALTRELDELRRRARSLQEREEFVRSATADLRRREAELAEASARRAAHEAPQRELPAPGLVSAPTPSVPVAPPGPAPAPPQPEPVPVPPPAVEAATEVPKLWELERLVATQPHDDAFVQAERETTLFAIREYAAVDGTIPPQFHMLVDDVFGELIART